MKLSAKKILILADWLVKWGIYLQNELTFAPKKLKAYKNFARGSAYYMQADWDGSTLNFSNAFCPDGNHPHMIDLGLPSIDLGLGFINNHDKGATVVVNQIRYVSKMRIEKPKTSLEGTQRMEKDNFEELVKRIQRKILP